MKKSVAMVLSALVFLVGLGLLLYPTISNYLHEQSASQAITQYISVTSQQDTSEDAFAAARAYNATLSGDVESLIAAQDGTSAYWDILNEVDGIMGIIEIPTLDLTLPIYHSTDESVLQKGVGHLEGSALPTGDVGNHTVLTGHTGLPSADLFTNLDQMVVGDRFYLEILDQVFTYEVINLYVVLPADTTELAAQADKDLVTLVTCTPYGVNSHRLLVQAQRVDVPVEVIPVPTIELAPVAPSLLDKLLSLESLPLFDNLPLLIALVCGVGLLSVAIGYLAYDYHYRRRFILPDTPLPQQSETAQ